MSAMPYSIDELWAMPDRALIAAYAEARRQVAEKKFARDTQLARLEWMRAKMFVNSSGGVTARRMAVDLSEELARKGQEVREMTRDADLLKVDIDVIALVLRRRGGHGAAMLHVEDSGADEPDHEAEKSELGSYGKLAAQF